MSHSLELHGVLDRGVPNKERICIIAREDVDVRLHGILIGYLQTHNIAVPLPDNYFWFGGFAVRPGDWIYVFTGEGETKSWNSPNGENKVHYMFWGRTETVFHTPQIVPLLFAMGELQVDGLIAHNPVVINTQRKPLPQLPSRSQ